MPYHLAGRKMFGVQHSKASVEESQSLKVEKVEKSKRSQETACSLSPRALEGFDFLTLRLFDPLDYSTFEE